MVGGLKRLRGPVALATIVLLGVALPCRMPAPCEAKDRATEQFLVSMDVRNEALRSVLERIAKATGYEITVSAGWAGKKLSVNLENVEVDKALKQVIEAIGNPSHVILTLKGKPKIEILICAGDPSLFEKERKGKVEALARKTGHQRVETVAPEEPGQGGVTQAEVDVKPSQQKAIDWGNTEVIPPKEPGGKGVTQSELDNILSQHKNIDPRTTEVIPPRAPGQRGVTQAELEEMLERQGAGVPEKGEKSAQ